MATYQLGPEAPRPFCSTTEWHSKYMQLPQIPEHEKFTFGPEYEKRMCSLVHQYLELGTDDRLCYVGDNKGSMVTMLQHRFCLVEPVTAVVPGHIHYEESPHHRMLAIKISHTGAEEFFRVEGKKEKAQFDKILLKDAIHFFDTPREAYRNMIRTMSERGIILIIHRPAFMNTLPVFKEARDRMLQYDEPYMGIIQDLQACNLDVQWQVECVPVVMPKLKWLSMMKERFPQQLEAVSQYEVNCGVRELSEGVLKYEGDTVEFMDRLLFISARVPEKRAYPTIQRFNSTGLEPIATGEALSYKMEVTDDVKPIVLEAEKSRRPNVSLPARSKRH